MISKSKTVLIGILILIVLLLIIFYLRLRLLSLNKNNQTNKNLIVETIITVKPAYVTVSHIKNNLSPILKTVPDHGSVNVSKNTPLIIEMGSDNWLLSELEFSIVPSAQFTLKKEGKNLVVNFNKQLETGTTYTYRLKSKFFPDGSSATYSFTTEGTKEGYQYDTGIIEEWIKENEEIKKDRIDVYVSNLLDSVPPEIFARSEYRNESNNGRGGFVIIVSSERTPEETKQKFEDWLKNQGFTPDEINRTPIEYYPKGQEPVSRPINTPYLFPTDTLRNTISSLSPTDVVGDNLHTTSDKPFKMVLELFDVFMPRIEDTQLYQPDTDLRLYPSPINSPESFTTVTPYVIPLGNGSVQKIIGLAQTIIGNCYAPDETGKYERGRVRRSNHLCLNSVQDIKAQLSLRVFLSSGFEYLQCVNFIHASNRILYGRPLENGRSSNNAIDFSYYVPYGYKFIYKNDPLIPLHPGTFAIWDYDTFGHIAYVTQVYNQKTLDFEVADANSKGKGVTAIQKKINKPSFKGWLVKIN